MWDWLAPVAGAVLGATQGNKGGEVTQSNSIDPRIANLLYGSSGTGGLLGDAQSIYQQQMQQGGLNDMQRQGLNMQAQYLQSPQYQNSYQMMMNQGMGLLGQGIAGNPFTRSQGGQQSQPMGQGGFQYSQAPTQIQTIRPQVQAPAQQTAPQASQPSANLGMNDRSGGGNISTGSGGGSSAEGSGYTEAGISASLAAMAASENPVLRALAPMWAEAIGLGGRMGADSQMNGVSTAVKAMDNIAKTAMPGVGSYLGTDGKVSTVSTPGLLAAADRALFGDPEGDGPQQSSGGAAGSGYGNYSFGNRSGGNIGSMGGGQGVRGTANGGLSGGFQGGGGLGIRGSW